MSETSALPQLTLEEKWATAEDNLIYFVVSGITYAKAKGDTPEDFGAWAGAVAVPFWADDRGKGPWTLVEGIAYNKQQFKDFAIEILRESPTVVEARMRGYGADVMADYTELDVTADCRTPRNSPPRASNNSPPGLMRSFYAFRPPFSSAGPCPGRRLGR